MNSRVEPDGESTLYKIKNFAENIFSKSENIPTDKKELEKYIEDKMNESKFSRKIESSYEINYTNTNKFISPEKEIELTPKLYSYIKSEPMDFNSKNN